MQELARALEEGDFDGMAEQKESKQTTILAPPDCHKHITGPFPVVRGGKEPPPENVNRLHVLTDSGEASRSTFLALCLKVLPILKVMPVLHACNSGVSMQYCPALSLAAKSTLTLWQ